MKSNANKRVLVIDSRPPTPNYDSGSLRMRRLLDILQSLSCSVTFAASYPYGWPPLTDRAQEDILDLQRSGIEVVLGQDIVNVDEHLKSEGRRYAVVMLSGGVYIASRHIEAVLKHAPQARVIFDTVDLHFLREYRHARLTGSVPRLQRALRCKMNELALARRADYTLVVSALEKEILEKECPEANVHVVSNVHEALGSQTSFIDRRDILFVGAFQHLPNIDAVNYFMSEIFPLVKNEITELKIHIIGGDPPPAITGLAADDVVVTGHVPDITEYFERCKLSIAPLRFGAGVKGKVLMSMSQGVPVVASSIAVEGLDLTSEEDALIADTPEKFSEAVVRVYRNEELWHRLSLSGLDLVARRFSFENARSTLDHILTSSTP